MSIATTPDQVRQRVREYLRQSLSVEVADDRDIFLAGFVNSLFAVQLVMFVEQDLGVPVDNEEMELDNFRSIDAIAAFVTRKTEAGGR